MKGSTCIAFAGTNIALVKYWGKRDQQLNLPATGSLSLTLRELGTCTAVRFDRHLGNDDRISLNGSPPGPLARQRIVAFLDLVRARAEIGSRAEVISANSVPTAAGLASSASGFAALALAASAAAGLSLSPTELSALARRGSGSAARSVFGGFVELQPGSRPDGSDSVATALPQGDDWPLRLVVAETARGEKSIGSTEAMERTARTSPYYPAWVESIPPDLAQARAAILAHDLPALGALAERNALRMHACAMAANPPVVYWNAATLAVMNTVWSLRARGVQAYFTIDGGPHVKVLCHADDAAAVQMALAATNGVHRTLIASPGGDGVTVTGPHAVSRSDIPIPFPCLRSG